MSLPYRSLFRYSNNISLFLSLPITPWNRSTSVIGGDIEADSGVRAAYKVRRDEFLSFSLRFYEEEWPYIQMLIDYMQTGSAVVWYPDQDDLNTTYAVYLESPTVDGSYQAIPDGTYPKVFQLPIVLVRAQNTPWNLPPYMARDTDLDPPDGPTGWVIHTFLYNTLFTVLAGSGEAEILIVGGGGSGGSVDGSGVGAGGGGAGGVRHLFNHPIGPGTYAVAPAPATPAPHAEHMIGIGAAEGNDGGNTTFDDIVVHGGGAGAGGKGISRPSDPVRQGRDGASGGGGASSWDQFTTSPTNNDGGAAIWPLEMGHAGGAGANAEVDDPIGAGGGGATGPGSPGVAGAGYLSDIGNVDGEMYLYAQGGGARRGGAETTGKYGHGGGGGGGANADGGTGSQGVVIIRYPIESGIVALGGIRLEYPNED